MKRRKILIALLVLIVILVILLIITSNIKDSTEIAMEQLEFINDNYQYDDSYRSPDNIIEFGNIYNGELSTSVLKKSAYYVATEVFPEYYADLKDVDDEKIEKYYSKYSESIKINLAIDNQKQFTNLIHELQELSGDELVWQSYRIDVDTIKVGANYTKAVLYITYEENSEIPINIKVKNKMSNNYSSIVYTVST